MHSFSFIHTSCPSVPYRVVLFVFSWGKQFCLRNNKHCNPTLPNALFCVPCIIFVHAYLWSHSVFTTVVPSLVRTWRLFHGSKLSEPDATYGPEGEYGGVRQTFWSHRIASAYGLKRKREENVYNVFLTCFFLWSEYSKSIAKNPIYIKKIMCMERDTYSKFGKNI